VAQVKTRHRKDATFPVMPRGVEHFSVFCCEVISTSDFPCDAASDTLPRIHLNTTSKPEGEWSGPDYQGARIISPLRSNPRLTWVIVAPPLGSGSAQIWKTSVGGI
jgi:hypothetical protein